MLLGRPQTVAAVRDELAERGHEPLCAPELVEIETLNALRRLGRGGRVSEQRASEAAADLGRTRLARYPHEPLRERVWELRNQLTTYDAAYLALAEIREDAVLMTSDEGLAARARASLGAGRVRLVE